MNIEQHVARELLECIELRYGNRRTVPFEWRGYCLVVGEESDASDLTDEEANEISKGAEWFGRGRAVVERALRSFAGIQSTGYLGLRPTSLFVPAEQAILVAGECPGFW